MYVISPQNLLNYGSDLNIYVSSLGKIWHVCTVLDPEISESALFHIAVINP